MNNIIKSNIVSFSDSNDGASIAALRLHKCINSEHLANIMSNMVVARKESDYLNVIGPNKKNIDYYKNIIKLLISRFIQTLQKTNNPIHHSLSLFPSHLVNYLNKTDSDIIHLNWVQNETLSIEDIGKIKKPILWTLHDSWPFCGSEHHPNGIDDKRFIEGYSFLNRSNFHKGIDIDQFTWKRKKRSWKKKFYIIAPSNWIATNVKKSYLFKDLPLKVIPTPIPTNIYQPFSKEISRKLFNLPLDKKLVLFGANAGIKNSNKGWASLKEALKIVSAVQKKVEFVVLGQSQTFSIEQVEKKIHFIGRLNDDQSKALLFSSVNVVVVPSKLETLCQVAMEAQSCGTPVVAFNISGMKDSVAHLKSGFLAEPYDPKSLAEGINMILNSSNLEKIFSMHSRKRAVKLWNEKVISNAYNEVYEELYFNKGFYI